MNHCELFFHEFISEIRCCKNAHQFVPCEPHLLFRLLRYDCGRPLLYLNSLSKDSCYTILTASYFQHKHIKYKFFGVLFPPWFWHSHHFWAIGILTLPSSPHRVWPEIYSSIIYTPFVYWDKMDVSNLILSVFFFERFVL